MEIDTRRNCRRVRFVSWTAGSEAWCEVQPGPGDWAFRSLKREIEEVIMVEVLIEEMSGSD